MDQTRLEQQIEFCREIDKEKMIGRQTYLSNGSRKENDAEHAWHMAVMTFLLSEYANEEIDVLRTIMRLLIHDMLMMNPEKVLNRSERKKRLTEFLQYFQKIREQNYVLCGKNLKPVRLQNPDLPARWIIFSR